MTVAESIWKVSSNASNINHILIAIHGYNQFTFNISIVLLLSALGNLTIKTKTNQLPLLKADAVFKKLQSLDIIYEKSDKKILFEFLSLFQSYQRLMCLSAAMDVSLTEMHVHNSDQLDQLEECLKKTIQTLNKTIRDQKDLNENPLVRYLYIRNFSSEINILMFFYFDFFQQIVHFIELVMNNMSCIRPRTDGR